MKTVFVHGAPNGPEIWDSLVAALAFRPEDYLALALPGFAVPCPHGFVPGRDAYASWLVDQLDRIASKSGSPVRIVGHDFGAGFTLRASSIRPDLVKSWVVFSSLIDSETTPHALAKLFRAPISGELLARVVTNRWLVAKGLEKQGLSRAVARREASSIGREMARSVLALYRTPYSPGQHHPWEEALAALPERGLLVWGADDPYVPVASAQRFAERWGYPLHIEPDAGHWVYAQKPDVIARRLDSFWAGS